MRQSILRLVLLATAISATCLANGIVVLDFENIAPYPNSSNVFVQDFYNGGTSSIGTSGTNFGVSFNEPALLICLNTIGQPCPGSNTSRGGVGNPSSERGGLFFLTSNSITMDVAGGFDTGFSFNYTAINNPGGVQVYDGAGGTGNLLATFDLPTTTSGPCQGYNAGFCPFFPVGVPFDGTALSVVFAGVGNQIVFDDITFGSETPGPGPGEIPEPATVGLVSIALGGLFVASRRSQARIDGNNRT